MTEEIEKTEKEEEAGCADAAPEVPLLPDLRPPSAAMIDAPMTAGGNTYLHELCERDAPLALVRDAIERCGADPNVVNVRGLPPLALAIESGTVEVVRYLLQAGAFQGIGAFNAVFYAVSCEKTLVLDALLEAGPGGLVNRGGLSRHTNSEEPPIYVAINAGNPHMVRRLLAAGAFVSKPLAIGGHTVLHRYAQKASADLLPDFLRQGADINARDLEGRTPLHLAAQADRSPQIEALVNAGALVDALDRSGETPLHIAAIINAYSAVESLLALGAQIDQARPDGRTALMLAAERDHLEVVQLLVKNGADLLQIDENSKTARLWAKPGSETLLWLKEVEGAALRVHFEKVSQKGKTSKPGRTTPKGPDCPPAP